MKCTNEKLKLKKVLKKVLQFNLKRRTVDSAKEKLKGKFLKGMILFTRGQMITCMTNTSTGQMTDLTEGKWKCFSFNYVIKEMVNVAAVQPSSYGCTWEVC